MNLLVRKLTSRLVIQSMRQRMWAAPRRRVLCSADGKILEIGFGAGANLPFYPDHIRRLTAIEPDPHFTKHAGKALASSHINVDLRQAAAEALPFADHSFDCVVSTLTFCSLRDPSMALTEIQRVLKPGGRFLFMEHGLADHPDVRRWQHRLTPVFKAIACGCHLNRDISNLIHAAEFRAIRIREDYIPKTPKFVGLLSEGIAEK
ncbi:MAG: class I SAM-dependent methyltransferase [Luteolibacter sp.]|jgi:ubiquinone/menaquinone biosynthesis C-methylase UbiE